MFNNMMTPKACARAILGPREDYTVQMQTWEKVRGRVTTAHWIMQSQGTMVRRYLPKPFNQRCMTRVIERARRKGGHLWCAEISAQHYDSQIQPLLDEFQTIVVSGIVVHSGLGTRCFLAVSASGADALNFKLTYVGQDRTPV
jgi:hypothetical protein